MIGQALGHYRIEAKLGAGGMGVVYRARDTRLNRDVAIKVLPEAFARDPERLARFEREARVLASLNHQNIAAIYGFENDRQECLSYLVLEYVPGEILRGPLPLEEALDAARQLAEALDAAHEKGVVHRDLKPANIKITPEGKVKVLDFGLAKALAEEPSGDPAQSPTLSLAATRVGTLLGTAAYMSPEQARGRPLDRRTDIWSFGCVLYEILAGRSAFGAGNITDTIAAVVTREPDWSALPPETPPGVGALLRRCLEKDTERRLRDIGDARLWLEETPAATAPATAPGPSLAARRRRPLAWVVAWVVGCVLALALASVCWIHFRETPPAARVVRFLLSAPENGAFTSPAAVSPDGTRLVFAAQTPGRQHVLWIRPIHSLTAQPLAGTDGAAHPFWSPDGRFVGFFAESKLKKIDVGAPSAPGPPQTLCSAPNGRGGSWNREGTILFAPAPQTVIHRVPAAGGEPVALTALDTARQENSHRWPHFLPDGRRFLYFARSAQADQSGVFVASLEAPANRKRLVGSTSNAAYAATGSRGAGHLLFLRERTLMAQAFDLARLEPAGEPFLVAGQVSPATPTMAAGFSVSEGGVLAYGVLSAGLIGQLAWFDRSGRRIQAIGQTGTLFFQRLSPDQKRVAVTVVDQSAALFDIWLIELARGIHSRFTFNGGLAPVWSPDASRLAYSSFGAVYLKPASGAGDAELVAKPSGLPPGGLSDWSPDGRFLVCGLDDPKTKTDLWVLPLSGDRKPQVFLRTPSTESGARFSPDSRWIAYTSDESGRDEVYVQPFPRREGKWQVSTQGGNAATWRSDGKEMFYLAADGKLMVVPIKAASGFEAGTPVALFDGPGVRFAGVTERQFDVSTDGRRFLFATPLDRAAASDPLTVVVNWTAELNRSEPKAPRP